MTSRNIAVLLSTYNGEQFLREQLDSIFAQQDVSVEVFVRDDGSSDGTKEILNEYAAANNCFHIIAADKNLGPGNSFMELLYSVGGGFDYYAFSDQDDIWLNDKLIQAVLLLEQSDSKLYASNQTCVDSKGEFIGLRYAADVKPHLSADEITNVNMLAGCTMVFTRELYELLNNARPSPDVLRLRMHDVWVAAVAALNGGIIYDERSFIEYRQHDNNVVGAFENKSFAEKVKIKTKKLFNKKLRNGRSLFARDLCRYFPRQASEYPIIEYFANADRLRGKRGLLKQSKKVRSYTGETRLGYFLKVICGWV